MQESRQAHPGTEPPGDFGLLRRRLRLALLAIGIVPLIVAGVVLHLLSPRPLPLTALVSLFAIGLILMPVALWLSRRLLGPAEALDRTRVEMRRLYESAKQDALKDALTGLGNHRAFQEELDRQMETYERYNVPIALLLIDIDDLKLVNEVDGHGAGDEMLREFGRMIGQVTRFADRAFRTGGDEFAVLMPHTNTEDALKVAKRLQEKAGQALGRAVQFSGGISACPTLATTRSQLYAQADAALFWCKRHGRATVDLFHPVRDKAASVQASTELSAAIARVVAERLLRPVYQPIVDLNSGRVIGFEGLIRPTPESGFVDPSSMFVAAENSGRTVELDTACIAAVVAGARNMASDQLLTINISPRTVEAPHFSAESVLAVLAHYGIDPGRVVVELTEREKVEDATRLQANLVALQRARVRIAADDVGAGNAGLRLLSQIRFDIVKIDLSLVQEGAERDSSRAVLRSLRDLASRWGAAIVAEGLETTSQLRTVRELGVAAGQGYLLGRPTGDTSLTKVDLAVIEAGGIVLERRPPAIIEPMAVALN